MLKSSSVKRLDVLYVFTEMDVVLVALAVINPMAVFREHVTIGLLTKAAESVIV